MFALAILAASHAPSPSLTAVPQSPTDEGRPIILGRSYETQSKILKGTRRINIYLPDSYRDPARKFPVLFLLDGGEREDFLHISAIAQITSAYGEGQEMIVVGIEGVDRRHDLTSPSSVASDLKAAPTAGGADTYRSFLIRELKPWVSSRFRTNGRSAIIGESLAGLFVLETLLRSPGDFEDFIAVSPSLWWNGGSLSSEAAGLLRRRRFDGQRAWIAFDTPPPPAEVAAKERALQATLEAAFRTVRPKGLDWTVRRSKEGHGTIYHPAAYEAFRKLYAIKPRPAP